jgi:hypothetical protein
MLIRPGIEGLPGGGLRAGGVENPSSDRLGEDAAVECRQKCRGQEQPAFGVVPADERLPYTSAPSASRTWWPIEKRELMAFQCTMQLCVVHAAGNRFGAKVRGEEAAAA